MPMQASFCGTAKAECSAVGKLATRAKEIGKVAGIGFVTDAASERSGGAVS